MRTVIDSRGVSLGRKIREIWEARELLWMLALRDFRVRYAQTLLGVAWAVFNPLVNLIILSFIFQRVAHVDTGNTPFLLFTAIGLLGWTYFAEVFSGAGESVLASQQMVKKVYFPRLVIPLAKGVTALIDLGVALALLFMLWGYYQEPLPWQGLLLPVFILGAILAGLGGGIWLSALTVRFRDFRYIAPVLLRIGFFASPIAYPASSVPEAWQWVYFLNPMAGVIESLRWCLTGEAVGWPLIGLSYMVIVLLLASGIWFFDRVDRVMADVL